MNKKSLFKNKKFYIVLILCCLSMFLFYQLKSPTEKAKFIIMFSPTKAINILEKAIQKNDTEAAIYLANIYWDKTYSLQNYEKAIQLCLSLPEEEKESNPYVQEKLGKAYEQGIIVEKNEEESLKWYTKAFNNGKQDIAFYLAEAYEKGENFKQDKQKEFYWLSRTIEVDENNCDALYNIGKAYLTGEVVKKDKEKAFDFFVKAADKWNRPACEYVGLAYFKGDEVKKDEERGIKYLTRATGYFGEDVSLEVLDILTKYYYGKDKNKCIEYARMYFKRFSPKQIADFFLNFKLIDSTTGKISTVAESVQNIYYRLKEQYSNNLDYINRSRRSLGLAPYLRLKVLQPRIWGVYRTKKNKSPYPGENEEVINFEESTEYRYSYEGSDLYEHRYWSFTVDLQKNKIFSGNQFGIIDYNPSLNFCDSRNAVITKRSEKSIHETECYFPITDEDILEYLFGSRTVAQEKAAKEILHTYFR